MVSKAARLPFLISVPHGGVKVPPKLRSLCKLDLPSILGDGDTWSIFLYSLENRVQSYHRFRFARAVLDLNRAPGELPPGNPDGVVKTVTVSGEQVWKNPGGLEKEDISYLLENYYHPYHQSLAKALELEGIMLGLDCHTMLPEAPGYSTGAGEKRPLVCLSNRGNHQGEEAGEPLTAPPDLIMSLAEALEKRLATREKETSLPAVLINQPFRGGHITRKHGSAGNIPWIQVEFNRCLYLQVDPFTAEPDSETLSKLNELRSIFIEALEEISSKQGPTT